MLEDAGRGEKVEGRTNTSETYCTCQNKTSHLLRKATDLCYAMVKTKKDFLNPVSRQNFEF